MKTTIEKIYSRRIDFPEEFKEFFKWLINSKPRRFVNGTVVQCVQNSSIFQQYLEEKSTKEKQNG